MDKFIRKFYLNRIIKGVLLSLSIYGAWYLIIVLAEHFGRFSTTFRTVLFMVTIALFAAVFVGMILIPFFKLLHIGRTLSYKQACRLIGEHFPEVSDKLQNTLELNELCSRDGAAVDIILASIRQRSSKLSPIPFVSAINLKKNLKYLRLFVPIVLIMSLLLIFLPGMLSEATERIIHFDRHYAVPPPFSFTLLNDSLTVKKGGDFTVNVQTTGNYIPDKVKIRYAGNSFYMEKEGNDRFSYCFKNLNNDLAFSFEALDIASATYSVRVLPVPIILNFNVSVLPPAYTAVEKRTYKNSGDITAPAGSVVSWSFNTSNLTTLTAVFDSTNVSAQQSDNTFSFERTVLKSSTYTLIPENDFFRESVGIDYRIEVIPDLFPAIRISERRDSAEPAVVYFNGFIDDDYGFSRLTFNCKPGEASDSLIVIDIPFVKSLTSQDFYYAFDFSDVDVHGRNITYYFEVFDNDGINGAKRTRSQELTFVVPTDDELQELSEQTNLSTERKIEEAKELGTRLQHDIAELQKRLINEQMTAWERNHIMQQIMDNRQHLEHLVDDIKKEQQSVLQLKQEFSKEEELLKKQEEINALMETLMDDEMRKLLDELQKLMENFDKDKFFNLAENLKYSTEEMEKNMDNTLELLRRSEVEERLRRSVDRLDELSEEHSKLADETKSKSQSSEELQRKLSEQKQRFDNIKNDYEETLRKNDSLSQPMPLSDFEEELQHIDESFEQSQQELEEGKMSKSSKSQKRNSQQMKQLAERMQSMLNAAMEAETGENLDDLRQLLENVLTFSFDQEAIMTGQRNLSYRNPRYREYIVKQKETQDNFDIIRDSITALSGRIPQLAALVNKEIATVYVNLRSIMEAASESRNYLIPQKQQTVMTSANNLALLLSEMMDQMQEQMMMQQQGTGRSCNKCKRPGSGKMEDLQQSLKKQMQDMLQQMKSGGRNNGRRSSEELAKMLMHQEMMQQMLNDMMSGGISPQAAKQLNEINRMMEQNINDIIGGNITPTTINRQEQMLTRLLRAENSERERETDQKRKSKQAKDYKLSNPDKAFEQKAKELRFNELLQMSNLKLNSFYNTKYKDFLKSLDNNR